MDSQHLSVFFFLKFPLFIESNIHFRVNWKDPLCYPSKMQNSQPGVIWELQAMGIPLKCILWLSSSNRYFIISRELYKGVYKALNANHHPDSINVFLVCITMNNIKLLIEKWIIETKNEKEFFYIIIFL